MSKKATPLERLISVLVFVALAWAASAEPSASPLDQILSRLEAIEHAVSGTGVEVAAIEERLEVLKREVDRIGRDANASSLEATRDARTDPFSTSYVVDRVAAR